MVEGRIDHPVLHPHLLYQLDGSLFDPLITDDSRLQFDIYGQLRRFDKGKYLSQLRNPRIRKLRVQPAASELL